MQSCVKVTFSPTFCSAKQGVLGVNYTSLDAPWIHQLLTMTAAPNAAAITPPPLPSTPQSTCLSRQGLTPQTPPPYLKITPQHHLIIHHQPPQMMMMLSPKRHDSSHSRPTSSPPLPLLPPARRPLALFITPQHHQPLPNSTTFLTAFKTSSPHAWKNSTTRRLATSNTRPSTTSLFTTIRSSS